MAGECADAWGDATRAGRTVNACDDMMKVTLRGVAETLQYGLVVNGMGLDELRPGGDLGT